MAQTGSYHGGLIFAGTQKNALDRFSRIVSATLEDYSHHVERQSIMNTQQARITASQYLVKLNLGAGTLPKDYTTRSTHVDAAGKNAPAHTKDGPLQRLEIVLCPVDPARANQVHAELLLVVMMYRMVEAYTAEYVEWLDPQTVLTTEEFLGAFVSVSPHRVHSRQQILDDQCRRVPRFEPVDKMAPELATQYDSISGQKPFDGHEGPVSLSDQEALSLAFRLDARPDEVDSQEFEDVPDSDVRRLASWGMTGMMFFISTPVATSLAVVNLIKGEDFRLNTHVLSFSCLLVVLESSGALASAVSYLPI